MANQRTLLNIQIVTSGSGLVKAADFQGMSVYFVLSNRCRWRLKQTRFPTPFNYKTTIPDNPINIQGYQLYRRGHHNQDHGSICLHAQDSIQCEVLQDLQSNGHEALWVIMRPTCLPCESST
ncbi:hypothetical protein P5673_029983 [Acropora cervicornis]|uniref:Uncharacterized protein n=1 Tax=Acropora cervicornis TaxID=6130 RepID=A0AAD9PUW3_ACRCE|nr:hypothetical protein P5673_029983 [Acropora cervicornis]